MLWVWISTPFFPRLRRYAFGITLWELYTGRHPFQDVPLAFLGHQVGGGVWLPVPSNSQGGENRGSFWVHAHMDIQQSCSLIIPGDPLPRPTLTLLACGWTALSLSSSPRRCFRVPVIVDTRIGTTGPWRNLLAIDSRRCALCVAGCSEPPAPLVPGGHAARLCGACTILLGALP